MPWVKLQGTNHDRRSSADCNFFSQFRPQRGNSENSTADATPMRRRDPIGERLSTEVQEESEVSACSMGFQGIAEASQAASMRGQHGVGPGVTPAPGCVPPAITVVGVQRRNDGLGGSREGQERPS